MTFSLLPFDALGMVCRVNRKLNTLGSDNQLWKPLLTARRGWLEQIQTTQFDAVCKQERRGIGTIELQGKLTDFYSFKELYHTRHTWYCQVCDCPAAAGWLAILSNKKLCKQCHMGDSPVPLAVNILSKKTAKEYYLLTDKILEQLPSAKTTLAMSGKCQIFPESACLAAAEQRFANQPGGFMAEVAKRKAKKLAKAGDQTNIDVACQFVRPRQGYPVYTQVVYVGVADRPDCPTCLDCEAGRECDSHRTPGWMKNYGCIHCDGALANPLSPDCTRATSEACSQFIWPVAPNHASIAVSQSGNWPDPAQVCPSIRRGWILHTQLCKAMNCWRCAVGFGFQQIPQIANDD